MRFRHPAKSDSRLFVLATLSVVLSGILPWGAAATTVQEVLQLSDQALSMRPEGVVTGVVSCVFRWQRNSCIIVSPDDVDGAGVYVGGMMPQNPAAVLKGASSLSVGDLVEVRGVLQPLLLDPGITAREITVLGRRVMPPPPVVDAQRLLSGRLNNYRVAVEGVMWGTRTDNTGIGPVTIFRVGTAAGPITMHVAGDHDSLVRLRNCQVRVEGVCLPMFNARGEFLGAEVEAFANANIFAVGNPPVEPCVFDAMRFGKGVLATADREWNGHLRRIVGSVTYCDPHERFFIVNVRGMDCGQSVEYAVRANLADHVQVPAVGDFVEAEGFPLLQNGCGGLEESVWKLHHGDEFVPSPKEIANEELEFLFSYKNAPGDDYHYRFVRLTGRIVAVHFNADGGAVFDVETDAGRLTASLNQAEGVAPEMFVDLPMAELTGILDSRLFRSTSNGRVLSAGVMHLRLRGLGDIRILPDAVARSRRIARFVSKITICAAILLALLVVWFLLRGWRRRVLAKALSEDRKLTAEELHDTVSQQLAGARLIIFSAKERETFDAETRRGLELAIEVLENARCEVRNAVFHLKNDDFSLKPVERLIRESVAVIAARQKVKIRTHLCPFPSWMTGTVKTDFFSIFQEALTNAIKHGKPRRVVILSERTKDNVFRIEVLNDGAPFDVTRVLGPEAGHFGLSNMNKRARRSGFDISFGRRREWTYVRLERGGA